MSRDCCSHQTSHVCKSLDRDREASFSGDDDEILCINSLDFLKEQDYLLEALMQKTLDYNYIPVTCGFF